MRIVFIGASSLAVMTAHQLLRHHHEVIIIESNKDKITALSEGLDCGFIHGDGSKPAILKEANPTETHLLFCLTDEDKTNILASLVGRSLGFQRIITRIDDPELEHVCMELGLHDTIIPDRTISRFLSDMAEGQDPLELSTLIRDEARIFSFVIGADTVGSLDNLALPDDCRVMCIYRDDKLILPKNGDELKEKDEVLLIVTEKSLARLKEKPVARK